MAGGPNPRRERDPVLVVAGPTASGKSEMAADAARKFDGVVINADSMQMYRDLSVLSARPTAAQIGEIPHRLFGVLDAADVCSAGRWREMARHELQAARRGGKLPIVVGGTGLYLKALIHGISDIPEIPAEIRIEVRNRVAAMGPERLHAELTVRDPKTAARLDPRDRQRIARALEVIEATGARLSDWTAAPSPASDDCENDFVVCALLPERETLYARCDRRFLDMLAAGALDEAGRLASLGLPADLPVMKALGVPPLLAYLRGEATLGNATSLAQRDTRRYAKRQMTWIRTQMTPGVVFSAQYSKRLQSDFFSFISKMLLTESD